MKLPVALGLRVEVACVVSKPKRIIAGVIPAAFFMWYVSRTHFPDKQTFLIKACMFSTGLEDLDSHIRPNLAFKNAFFKYMN